MPSLDRMVGIIDEIHADVQGIKSLLEKLPKPTDDYKPEKIAMTAQETAVYIAKKGIRMSESKLDKLTAHKSPRYDRTFPVHKVNDRDRLFYLDEIDVWCENQISPLNESNEEAIQSITKSARKKQKRS